MNVEGKINVQVLAEIEHLKVHGRTTESRNPLTLFWTGSGIELNARGTELWLEVEISYDSYEPWISILINDAKVSRIMLTRGRYWICVFRGMNGETVKNVRVIKDVQAMSDDSECSLKLHAVKFDGEFLPVEDKPYKIEFIGDSITSGEGAIGAKQEEDWIPMWFSALDNYSTMTAKLLNADYRILSQSGWGVLTSWDNNPNNNLPNNYEKVCGVLSGTNNEALGAFTANDFTKWQPDIIVVNLGTNDEAAFYTDKWRDDITEEVYKQRLNEDGTFHEEDRRVFEKAIESFLGKLRYYNNGAHIVWAYGMMGITMMPAIYRAVDHYIQDTGDKKVSVFQLPETTQDTLGAREHPGILAHENAAKELAQYLKQFLGEKK